MHKWIMLVLVIVACVTGLGVLFGDINERAAERAAAEAESKTPSLKITASNFKLDQPVYNVKAGETLKVSLRNAEGVHAILIEGYNVTLDPNNPSQDVKFDKPGEYTIRCVLACGVGHEQMFSKLIVQ